MNILVIAPIICLLAVVALIFVKGGAADGPVNDHEWRMRRVYRRQAIWPDVESH